MIAVFLMAAALAAPAGATQPLTAEALISQATDLLLNGEALPKDIDARLMALPPAERVKALIFLRRSGMLTGPGWTADRLLAPARTGVSSE